jgi:mono-ADP-ribosyltransferase sirtuin 6
VPLSCLCHCAYTPDFRAVATYEKTVKDHRTGRKCASCGGVLLDTIINFGEYLFEEPLQRARDNAKKADLCLVLGSSLTIPPANTIPEAVGKKKRGAKLAICNLQSTPLDNLSDLRIYTKSDDLMVCVMDKLDIPIPPFILHRRLVVEMETKQDTRHQLKVYGVDVDGTPVTFLQSVKSEYNRRGARSEPFIINFREELKSGTQLKLDLEFMGHYGEPDLEIIHEYVKGRDTKALHLLEYNPRTGEWKTSKVESDSPEIIDLTQEDVDKTAAALSGIAV